MKATSFNTLAASKTTSLFEVYRLARKFPKKKNTSPIKAAITAPILPQDFIYCSALLGSSAPKLLPAKVEADIPKA